MTDINSIIEMIEGSKATENLDHSYCDGYNEACDDIIEQLRKMNQWIPVGDLPLDLKDTNLIVRNAIGQQAIMKDGVIIGEFDDEVTEFMCLDGHSKEL